MDYNGKEAEISVMFMNSISHMIVENGTKLEYLDIGTAVEYISDDNEIIKGKVKSAIIIQSDDGKNITIPQNSKIKRLEDNFEGITTLNENDNLDILYNALDYQTFTQVVNGDGFISMNENDIIITSQMNINLSPQEGIIDGLTFSMRGSKDILIKSGGSKPRIDLVVIKKDQLNRTIEIKVKPGVASDYPKPETLTQTKFGIYELPIFSIYVDINETTLNRLNITDLRSPTYKNNTIVKNDRIGMIDDYAGNINKLPQSYMICDGREVSRAGIYAKLFDKVGTIWGAGNGSTTFNLPDGRGGVSKGAGTSAKYHPYNENRGNVGSYQSTAIRNITGFFAKQASSLDGSNNAGGAFRFNAKKVDGVGNGTVLLNGDISFDASRTVPVGQTNRDNNFAVIKVIYIGSPQ